MGGSDPDSDFQRNEKWEARLGKFFSQEMPSKFFSFAAYGRLIGTRRLLASEYKDQSTFAYVIGVLGRLELADYAEKLLKCRAIFSRYIQNNDIEVNEFDAAFSSALKAAEGKVPEIKGLYTLFNKMAVDPDHEKEFFETYHKPRIEKWLFTKYEKSEHFKSRFKSKIREIVAKISSSRTIDFETFIDERALWATSGATDRKDEVLRGFKKTKSSWAWSKKTSKILELYDRATINHRCDFSYIEKNEPGAVRLVILTDTFSYLAMSFVSHCIDKSLGNINGLFNYYDNRKKLRFWSSCIDSIHMGTWNTDVDFTGWDESVSHDIVNELFDAMTEHFGIIDPYLVKYMNDIKGFFNNSYILGEKIVNGLASGLRWTTFINSMVNLALNQIALEDLDASWAVNKLVVLGDDVHIDSRVELKGYFELLNSYGFEVNLRKSHVSRDWGEFLKMKITKDGVRGDFVRGLRSLMWNSDDERDNGSKMAIMNQRIDIWVRLFSRNVRYSVKRSVIIDDLFHAAGSTIPKRTIDELLDTPRSLGGLGLTDRRKLDWEYEEKSVIEKKENNYRGPVRPTIIAVPYFFKGVKRLLANISNTIKTGVVRRKVSYNADDAMMKIYENTNFRMNSLVFISKPELPRLEPEPVIGRRLLTEFRLEVSTRGLYDTTKDWAGGDYDKRFQMLNAFRFYSKHLTKRAFNEVLTSMKFVTSNLIILKFGEVMGPLFSEALGGGLLMTLIMTGLTLYKWKLNQLFFEMTSHCIGNY